MPGGRRAPIDRALREYARVRRLVGPGRAISFDEAVHVAEGISRRDFVRLAGIAGASAMLAACDRSSPTEPAPSATGVGPGSDGPRVVIVGAGLAGMTAAYRLNQAGVRAQVFEARDRVGGRCWSARDFEGGQVAEHGGEFIDTRHVHMRVLVEELGLELDDLWSVWVPGSTWLSLRRRRDREALASEFRQMAAAIDEIVSSRRPGPSRRERPRPRSWSLDEMTAADWYTARRGALPRRACTACGPSASRAGTASTLGQLGAGSLIDFYAIDYPGGDERYTVRGGNDQVPARILDELPEGTVTFDAALEVGPSGRRLGRAAVQGQ